MLATWRSGTVTSSTCSLPGSSPFKACWRSPVRDRPNVRWYTRGRSSTTSWLRTRVSRSRPAVGDAARGWRPPVRSGCCPGCAGSSSARPGVPRALPRSPAAARRGRSCSSSPPVSFGSAGRPMRRTPTLGECGTTRRAGPRTPPGTAGGSAGRTRRAGRRFSGLGLGPASRTGSPAEVRSAPAAQAGVGAPPAAGPITVWSRRARRLVGGTGSCRASRSRRAGCARRPSGRR